MYPPLWETQLKQVWSGRVSRGEGAQDGGTGQMDILYIDLIFSAYLSWTNIGVDVQGMYEER